MGSHLLLTPARLPSYAALSTSRSITSFFVVPKLILLSSSFTWGINNCYSTLPSVTPSVACQRTIPSVDIGFATGPWTIAGQTVTEPQIVLTGTAAEIEIITTFNPSQTTAFAAVALGSPVILVHKASDKTGTAARVGGSASGLGVLATAYCAVLVLGALLTI